MTASNSQPEAAGSQAHPPVTKGDLVITWYDDTPVAYGGPGDGGPFTTLTFGLFDGRTPVRTCAPERAAPSDTTIPARDPRVTVAKRPRSEMPYGEAGTWQLTLPGQHPSWHRTKRDGTATGLRQLAILDWHAARAAQTRPAAQDGACDQPGEGRHLPRD